MCNTEQNVQQNMSKKFTSVYCDLELRGPEKERVMCDKTLLLLTMIGKVSKLTYHVIERLQVIS